MRLCLILLLDMFFHGTTGTLNDIKKDGKECKRQLLFLLAFNITWFPPDNFLHMN